MALLFEIQSISQIVADVVGEAVVVEEEMSTKKKKKKKEKKKRIIPQHSSYGAVHL
mgnify:CR=1 FL=1